MFLVLSLIPESGHMNPLYGINVWTSYSLPLRSPFAPKMFATFSPLTVFLGCVINKIITYKHWTTWHFLGPGKKGVITLSFQAGFGLRSFHSLKPPWKDDQQAQTCAMCIWSMGLKSAGSPLPMRGRFHVNPRTNLMQAFLVVSFTIW